MSESWIKVGQYEDIPRLGARVVRTNEGDIAVFRTADDEIFALGYVDEHVRPTLERYLSSADFSAILRQTPHYWALFRDSTPWAEPSISVPVRATPELHNAIASRLQMMEVARGEVRNLRSFAAETRKMTGY